MKEFAEILSPLKDASISVYAVIVSFAMICGLFGFLLSKRKDIASLWDGFYQRRKQREERDAMILEDHKKIVECVENRVNDREQSRKIQKELTDAISGMQVQLKELQESTNAQLKEIKDASDEKTIAEMRDRIMGAARYYRTKGEWNTMEKESFFALLKVYYSRNGNGYVKDKIEPEAYTWRVIDIDE